MATGTIEFVKEMRELLEMYPWTCSLAC